ncbi:hypothetical protein ABZ446_28490 [Streptomyces sp. NPDC005813]|uniref:hypothetical protein n=1 Tax=Streptomyces sp. NPDC005813 TaxID=3155592 RepID=UPI0033D5C301
MSARETLVTTLENAFARIELGRVDRHRAKAEEIVDAALNERAHEAAEELRTFVGPRAYPGEPEHVTQYVAGWHDAADRIDPEVT